MDKLNALLLLKCVKIYQYYFSCTPLMHFEKKIHEEKLGVIDLSLLKTEIRKKKQNPFFLT